MHCSSGRQLTRKFGVTMGFGWSAMILFLKGTIECGGRFESCLKCHGVDTLAAIFRIQCGEGGF